MNPDDFADGDNKAPYDSEGESNGSEDHYKAIEADRQRKIVIPTEGVWDNVVSVVEEEMWLEISEVLEMPDSDKFQIIHQAALSTMGYDILTSYSQKECVVCDEAFVFPHNWDFTRVRGETSCNDHSIQEVLECVEQVNQLDV